RAEVRSRRSCGNRFPGVTPMPDRLPPLVPLPLPEPDRRALRRRAVATVRSRVRHLSGVVVRRVLRRPRPGQAVARSLRLTFETLGATYVKLASSSPLPPACSATRSRTRLRAPRRLYAGVFEHGAVGS